jgi:hypothetical protein
MCTQRKAARSGARGVERERQVIEREGPTSERDKRKFT